jgi:outer membrane protein, heavy metal efflux system
MTRLFACMTLLSALMAGCVPPVLLESPVPPAPRAPVATPRAAPQTAEVVQRPVVPRQPQAEQMSRLTLEQALDLAERLHPALTAAQAQISGATGRALQAGLFPNPELLARIEAAPLTGRFTEDAEYIVGVSQPLPLGRRLSAARQAEVIDRDRLRHVHDGTRLDIRRHVQQTFATALYWQRVTQTRAEDVQIAANGVVVAQARLEAGDAIPAEVAQAEIEQHRAQLDLESAQSRQHQALEALAVAVGAPSLEIGSLEGTLDPPPAVPDFEALMAQLEVSPFAAAAEATIAAQQARIDLVQAKRIPDLTLDLAYRRVGDIENTVDVGVRMPLTVFDRQQGALHEARADLAAAEALARAREQELRLDLRAAYRTLTRALDQVRQLQGVILPRAERVLRVTEARYTSGDVSLSELLPVRRDWTKLRLDYLDALHDVKQAWAALSPYVQALTPAPSSHHTPRDKRKQAVD